MRVFRCFSPSALQIVEETCEHKEMRIALICFVDVLVTHHQKINEGHISNADVAEELGEGIALVIACPICDTTQIITMGDGNVDVAKSKALQTSLQTGEWAQVKELEQQINPINLRQLLSFLP
jgi:hypothetical protein